MYTAAHKAFPILHTERLVLREITTTDTADLFNYYNDRQLTQYLDWFGPRSVMHAEEMILNWAESFQHSTFMRWGITLKGENRVIGTVLLQPVRGPFEWKLPLVTGYELSREYWNQGIMTEAVQAVITYAFETLGNHRITAEVFPANGASRAILKKFGFEQEGVLKQHLWHEGYETWNDVMTFGLLKDNK